MANLKAATTALNAGIVFGRMSAQVNNRAGIDEMPLSGDHMARLNYILTGNSIKGSTPLIKTGVNVWDMVRA